MSKLYHQTDAETAEIILRTQRMQPGSSGLAGGGIYFATTAELTGHKAHKKGVILEATVALGKMLTLTAVGDPTMTLQKLKSMGFDSVCIARPVSSGQEYVVYDPGQVMSIDREDGQRPPPSGLKLEGGSLTGDAVNYPGTYRLVVGKLVNGRPAYQHTSDATRWIAFVGNGWMGQPDSSLGEKVGFLDLQDSAAATPDVSTMTWKAAGGAGSEWHWVEAPQLKCTAWTPPSPPSNLTSKPLQTSGRPCTASTTSETNSLAGSTIESDFESDDEAVFTLEAFTRRDERVQCRENSSGWKVGRVTSVKPLKVQPDGYSQGQTWDEVRVCESHCEDGQRPPADNGLRTDKLTRTKAVILVKPGIERSGSLGVVIQDDHDGTPFKVRFEDGETKWYKESQVQYVGEFDDQYPVHVAGSGMSAVRRLEACRRREHL